MFLGVKKKTLPKANSLLCYVMFCFLHVDIYFLSFLLFNISSAHFIGTDFNILGLQKLIDLCN